MRDDVPVTVSDALERAVRAFDVGAQTPETGLADLSDDIRQLRKACRLLDASRPLRQHDGFYVSVIEMSFAVIERTVEYFVLNKGTADRRDLMDHTTAYERATDAGAFDVATGVDLQALYQRNRTGAYYGDRVPAAEQASAMFELAGGLHDHLKHLGGDAHECICER